MENRTIISEIKIFFIRIAVFTQFLIRFFKEVIKPPYEFTELLKQCYFVGNKSLSLVGITGFIIGLVLTIQSRPTLVSFGAESWLPAMVGVSIVREIVPILTALICAGKVGSGISAELASMRVTEQIDAMEVSGTNPFNFLIVTRTLATTIMIPLLVIFADSLALIGSYIGITLNDDISLQLFFSQVFHRLAFGDIFPALIKTYFFGFAIGLVGCYKGYNCRNGTEGVGRSANEAVVIASLLVFILDMIAVLITNMLHLN